MFELANPWALILIPVPVLVWLMLPKCQKLMGQALKIPFYQQFTTFALQQEQAKERMSPIGLLLLVWTLLIIALAGPRWVGELMPADTEGYNIMLALDLSGSMDAHDMILHGRAVSRLNVVKHAAEQFVENRPNDHIGLVLFGTRAYLMTPLTYDKQTVLAHISDATVGLAGKTTSIGDALGVAIKNLALAPKEGRVVILLTDGVNNSGVLKPLKAAELAKSEYIKVYTIGLGRDASSMMQQQMMLMGGADLDEQTLSEMAKMTGGQYFRATDATSLQKIYQTIDVLEKIHQKQSNIRPEKDYYPWPLGLGILLLLGWLFMSIKSVTITRRAM